MSICQVLHRQKVGLGHVTLLDFILNIFTGVELLTSEVICHLWDGSPTVPNQDCVMDVEEFCSTRSSRASQLWQHCKVEHCHEKEEELWSTILVSFDNSLFESVLEFPGKQLHLLLSQKV